MGSYTHIFTLTHKSNKHTHTCLHMKKQNRGFAFVRFKDAAEAMAAKAALHETPIGKEEYK